MTRPPLTELHLAAGEARTLHLRAGTTLWLGRGELRLAAAPQTLDGVLLPATVRLRQGVAHAMSQRGWVTLQARSTCTLHVHAPPPIWSDHLVAALRHTARWCAARVSRFRPRFHSTPQGANQSAP